MRTFALLLLYYVCVHHQTEASKLSFEALPKEIMENITESVSMRCSVSDNVQTRSSSSATDVRHISSIYVSRGDDDDVASVTAFDPPSALADLGNLHVTGSISAVSGEGFLDLSWTDASKMVVGEYVCTVAAIDTRGRNVLLNTQLTMTSVTPTIMDLFENVNLKVDKLQKENQQLHQNFKHQTLEVQSLQQDNQKLQTDYQQLHTKLNLCFTQVAFQAALTHAQTLSPGQTVVYDTTMLNDGDGYNNQTGSFICSHPGVYLFNAHALNNRNEYVRLNMKLNANTIVSSLYAGFTSDQFESGSMSAVLHLKAGDVVNVVATHSSSLFDAARVTRLNTFSGHLIQVDGCQQ